jgi:hypothetical protein
MPRAISPFAYPVEYWDLVRGCAHGGRFEVEIATPKAGSAMQQKFYAFRTALRRENDKIRLGINKLTEEQQQRITEHLKFAEMTICWIDRGKVPSRVTYCNVDQHPDALFLRKALASGSVPAVPEDIQQQLAETAQRMLREGTAKPDDDPTGGKYG